MTTLAVLVVCVSAVAYGFSLTIPNTSKPHQRHPKLLIRQIREAKTEQDLASTVSALLTNCTDDKVWTAVIRQSYNIITDPNCLSQTVLQLYHQHPTESCRTNCISALGRTGNLDVIEELLHHPPNASIASWHAGLAACQHNKKDWPRALDWYHIQMPMNKTTMTTNIMLGVLAKNRRGSEALAVLHAAPQTQRNSISYFSALQALFDETEAMYQLLVAMIDDSQPIHEDMWDMAIRSCTTHGNWSLLRELDRLREDAQSNCGGHSTRPVPKVKRQEGWTLPKVGRGKTAYYLLGTVCVGGSEITIGAQPHKGHPRRGVTLTFRQENNGHSEKVGFLLATKPTNGVSELLGMQVYADMRQRGWSKVILGCWLAACHVAQVKPRTTTIHKPLLCATLEHRFGFQRQSGTGIPVEISRDPDNAENVILYSPQLRSLEGAMSPWDIQRQHLQLASSRPSTNHRLTHISCRFVAPPYYNSRVEDALECWPRFLATEEQLRCVLVG